MKIHPLSDTVRITIQKSFGQNVARIEQKQDNKWNFVKRRYFELDVRLPILATMEQLAKQEKLI